MKKHATQTISKLWGTAFAADPDPDMLAFTAGRDVAGVPPADEVLIPYEIAASTAHVEGLKDAGLISRKECRLITAALGKLMEEYQSGRLHLDPAKEDVHTNVESWLTEKLGIAVAGKLHTGRSRNEQSIVNNILYLRDTAAQLTSDISRLVTVLHCQARIYDSVVIPGYTHHQPATVTTLGAVFGAYASEFETDVRLFEFWREHALISPMGAAAGYGTTLPVDKAAVMRHLGLTRTFDNPIQVMLSKGDAESLFVYAAVMHLTHLSSLAETLILFSTAEFGFLTLSDAFTTGSSIMPQKKNPDPLEVIKAKASVCQGYLSGILGIAKAAFIGYNRDSQWLKYLVLDTVREIQLAPRVMAGLISTLTVNREKTAAAIGATLLSQAVMEGLITELGLPMRQAKMVVETALRHDGRERLAKPAVEAALRTFGCGAHIQERSWSAWTDPQTVAGKQLKRGCAMKHRQPQG